MNLPNLSQPVNRNQVVSRNLAGGINPSGVCSTCCNACNKLPSWPAFLRRTCKKVCQKWPGCHC